MQIPSAQVSRYMTETSSHIIWHGTTDGKNTVLRLRNNRDDFLIDVDTSDQLTVRPGSTVLLNGDVANHEGQVSVAPPGDDYFAVLRSGAMLGMNPGASATLGVMHIYQPLQSCVCAYDLEVNLEATRTHGFPFSDVPILSSSISCSCGYSEFLTSLKCDPAIGTGGLTSRQISDKTIGCLYKHQPQWLIGWNCYAFDNSCLLFHCNPALTRLFVHVKVGGAGIVSYGYILNIPGVYNMDIYGYMLRTSSGSYDDMSLKTVASTLKCRPKLEMPPMTSAVSLQALKEYNMNDCLVTIDVWNNSNVGLEIALLSVCLAAPIYDSVRYITGGIASCALASDAALNNAVFDWTRCPREQDYRGGTVLDPERGLHRDAVICDYSSMYPTIMADANISPQSLTLSEPQADRPEGSVWWSEDHRYVHVALDDRIATFDRAVGTLHREMVRRLIRLRKQVKLSQPLYAKALKEGTNTIYGCLGYEHSFMYSPSCSASITTIGRWLLAKAQAFFLQSGLSVIYGDTDSCVNARTTTTDALFGGDVVQHCQYALGCLHGYLRCTPFNNSTMELESRHPGIIMLDKKRYCKQFDSGKIKFVGVAAARRNALGICRSVCVRVAEAILNQQSTQQVVDAICTYLEYICQKALSRSLTLQEVSMIARRDGMKCYIYTNTQGREVRVPVGDGAKMLEQYDVESVMRLVKEEVHRFTIPCGFGTCLDLFTSSSVF